MQAFNLFGKRKRPRAQPRSYQLVNSFTLQLTPPPIQLRIIKARELSGEQKKRYLYSKIII